MNLRLTEREGFAALVLRLRAEGIGNTRLYAALEQTPRTVFIGAGHAEYAYENRLLPIDCGSYAESPDLVARLLALAEIGEGHRVLDIGTGSGYLAAAAARLGNRVLTIDRYKTLAKLAQQRFQHIGLNNVVARQADGIVGIAGEGTFDRIIATAAFESLPRHYVDFLVPEGVMIAPVPGKDGVQRMARLVKIGSRFERDDRFETNYLPLISGLAAAL